MAPTLTTAGTPKLNNAASTEAAREAYRRRVRRRARRHRAQTQELRLERERLALAFVLRRELAALARDAGELARSAQGSGRAAEVATARLQARRRRAQEVLAKAQRFALDLALDELDAADRIALGLRDA